MDYNNVPEKNSAMNQDTNSEQQVQNNNYGYTGSPQNVANNVPPGIPNQSNNIPYGAPVQNGAFYTQPNQYYAPQAQYPNNSQNNSEDYEKENNKRASKIYIEKRKGVSGIAVFFIVILVLIIGAIAGLGMHYIEPIEKLLPKAPESVVQEKTEDLIKDFTSKDDSADESTPTEKDKTESKEIVSNNQVADVVEANMPAMVSINTKYTQKGYSFFGGVIEQEASASGSGIIISSDEEELLILTNSHVINGAQSVSIVFCDEKEVDAIVKSYDEEKDLAIVSVPIKNIEKETMEAIKFVTLGDSDSLKLGEQVVAIGNSLGYGQTVTVGYVSALGREVSSNDGYTRKLIQTDAAINPGNSGGALLNMKGELVGINESKIADASVDGVGFAIPVSSVKEAITNLSKVETRETVPEAERGALGVKGVSVSEEAKTYYNMPAGAYVSEVTKDSAAEKAGIIKGDIITQVDETKVGTFESLASQIAKYRAGEKVTIKYLRNTKDSTWEEQTAEVVLDKMADINKQ